MMGAGSSRSESRSEVRKASVDEQDVASSSDWSVENAEGETATSAAVAANSSTTAPTQTRQDNKPSKEAEDKKRKQEEAYKEIRVEDVWLKVDETAENPPSLKQDTERTGWHTVRIFVSSTFRDFHSERDVLVKKVR